MADLTWSVKMPEELKEKVAEKLQESGLSGKEFMESLLNSYELQRMKEERPELLQDLQELEMLSKRICSVYINIGERISTVLSDKESLYKMDVQDRDTKIETLKENIKELSLENEELKKKSEQAENDKTAIEKEKTHMEARLMNDIKQLSEINQSNKALIEEYKQKNDTLSGLLTEYKEYKDKVQDLNVKIDQLRNNNRDLQSGIKDTEHELNTYKDKMAQVEERYKQEIENIKNNLIFEKDKALLEQKENMNNQLQELRDKHNAEVDKYNNKLKVLFDELEVRQKVTVEKKD